MLASLNTVATLIEALMPLPTRFQPGTTLAWVGITVVVVVLAEVVVVTACDVVVVFGAEVVVDVLVVELEVVVVVAALVAVALLTLNVAETPPTVTVADAVPAEADAVSRSDRLCPFAIVPLAAVYVAPLILYCPPTMLIGVA